MEEVEKGMSIIGGGGGGVESVTIFILETYVCC